MHPSSSFADNTPVSIGFVVPIVQCAAFFTPSNARDAALVMMSTLGCEEMDLLDDCTSLWAYLRLRDDFQGRQARASR